MLFGFPEMDNVDPWEKIISDWKSIDDIPPGETFSLPCQIVGQDIPRKSVIKRVPPPVAPSSGLRKPHTCTKCDLSFHTRRILATHLGVHERNAKKYYNNRCKLCGMGYNRASHLYKHMKRCHIARNL